MPPGVDEGLAMENRRRGNAGPQPPTPTSAGRRALATCVRPSGLLYPADRLFGPTFGYRTDMVATRPRPKSLRFSTGRSLPRAKARH